MRLLALLIALTISSYSAALAGSITVPVTYTNGQVLTATELNQCNSVIYTDYNGNINNFNIASNAGILLSKLALSAEAFNQYTTGQFTWASGLTTDANPEVAMTTNGAIEFGPGGSVAPNVGWEYGGTNTVQLFVPGGGTPTLNLGGATLTGLTLGVPNGGTGVTSIPIGDLVVGNGTSATTVLAPSANKVVTCNSGGTAFQTSTNLTVGQGGTGQTALPLGALLTGQGTSGIGSLSPAANQFVVGNSGATAFQMTASQQAALNLIAPTVSGAPPATPATGALLGYNGSNWVAVGTVPRYVSTATPMSGNATFPFTHGLGVIPTKIWFDFICTTANATYAIGDNVIVYPNCPNANGTSAMGVYATNTTLTVTTNTGTGPSSNAPIFVNKTGGTGTSITWADWTVTVYAEP